MSKLFCAFAVFALAGPVLAQETEHVSRTIALAPGGTLRLKSFSGRVNITATGDSQVVIDAVRRGSRERLDHIRLDISSQGSTVIVDANKRDSSWSWGKNNVVETDFDIKVPRRTNLDVDVFSAPITVEGVEGSYKIHGFSSRIRLHEVTGSIDAHTFSGPVEIRAKGWQDGQRVDVDTFSGDITLRVPASATGTVRFNSFSGHLNSDIPLTLRNGSRRSLTAELGKGGGGNLRFKTFSGSVRIDK